MVYLGLNAEYLPQTGASGNYLPGGLKKYSTQKVITYSDSTRKTVQDSVFCLFGNILNLVTKVAQTFPKSDKKNSECRFGNVWLFGLAPSNPDLQELNNQLRYVQYHLPIGVDGLDSLA